MSAETPDVDPAYVDLTPASSVVELAADAAARIVDLTVRAVMAVPYVAVRGTTLAAARRQPHWQALRNELVKIDKERANATSWTLDELATRWDVQDRIRDIEAHVSFAPRVEDWLLRASSASVGTDALHEARWAWQRVVRGWDDRAVWSMEHHLYRMVGEQLIALASVSHGWPGNDEFPTYESWVETLRFHGERLIAFSALTADMDPDTETRVLEEAQESMRWVADHMSDLWD